MVQAVYRLDLWSVSRAAQFLGKSKSWVYRQAEAGVLPSCRIGGSLRFRPEALEDYVRRNSTGHDASAAS